MASALVRFLLICLPPSRGKLGKISQTLQGLHQGKPRRCRSAKCKCKGSGKCVRSVHIAKGLARIISFSQGVLAGTKLELSEIAQDVVHNLCGQRDVGPVTASALAASIGSGHQFKNGREFGTLLGLTPTNRSSGGKERLGRITKMGDQYLRQLLVVGMTSPVRQTKSHPERANKWLTALFRAQYGYFAAEHMSFWGAKID